MEVASVADDNEATTSPHEEQVGSETQFSVGERVVVREDYHSKYFQGIEGRISGPARKGGTADPLWPVQIDITPHQIVIPGKYLRLPTDPPAEEVVSAASVTEESPAPQSKGSFLTRIIPWRRR